MQEAREMGALREEVGGGAGVVRQGEGEGEGEGEGGIRRFRRRFTGRSTGV